MIPFTFHSTSLEQRKHETQPIAIKQRFIDIYIFLTMPLDITLSSELTST